jgi:hypothetical protein
MSETPGEDQPDLVDDHFRPFARALGNLVIALAEATFEKPLRRAVGRLNAVRRRDC